MCQNYHGEELIRVVMVVITQIIVNPAIHRLALRVRTHFYMSNYSGLFDMLTNSVVFPFMSE
jgi:hypothetical protein